jgi:hypothetical protein
MISHEPRHPGRATAPSSGADEQLTQLIYELLDAHDDTARIATGQDLDPRWRAHLCYLRDLQRVAREQLADAGATSRRTNSVLPGAPTQEVGMFRRFGRLSIRILPGAVRHVHLAPNSKGGCR